MKYEKKMMVFEEIEFQVSFETIISENHGVESVVKGTAKITFHPDEDGYDHQIEYCPANLCCDYSQDKDGKEHPLNMWWPVDIEKEFKNKKFISLMDEIRGKIHEAAMQEWPVFEDYDEDEDYGGIDR